MQPIPESAYVALANVADFTAWRAAVARFFRAAPAPPSLAAFVTTRGGRLAFRGPDDLGPVLLDPDDDVLDFLRHRKDIALPLDRDAALGFVRFLRALADLGRAGPPPPLPTLAGSVRALAPGGEQVWVLCWWAAVTKSKCWSRCVICVMWWPRLSVCTARPRRWGSYHRRMRWSSSLKPPWAGWVYLLMTVSR